MVHFQERIILGAGDGPTLLTMSLPPLPGPNSAPRREMRQESIDFSRMLTLFHQEIATTGQTLPFCNGDGAVTYFRPLSKVFIGVQLVPGWQVATVEVCFRDGKGMSQVSPCLRSDPSDRMPAATAALLGVWYRWDRLIPKGPSELIVRYWRDVQ